MAGFLTVEETAELLRCCPDTVRAGIRRGDLAATRIGRTIRIPASQLGPDAEQFAMTRRPAPDSAAA